MIESGNPYVADYSEWPLVTINSPTSSVRIESFFDIVDTAMSRGTQFGIVHDIRGMPGLDAVQRKQFADYIEQKEGQLRDLIVGHAVVVDSAVERGIVTAVLWIRPAPFAVKVFTNERKAKEWIVGQLSSAILV